MSELTTKIKAFDTAYPERTEPRLRWLDKAGTRVAGPFLRWRRLRHAGRGRFFAKLVASHVSWAANLNEQQMREEAAALGGRLRQHGFKDELVARCFALIREAAGRTLGQRHFEVQLIGGRVLLNGLVAEMETGEGKTLTATLAAATAALAGIPVHIITVNDYLADRDAQWMGPIYESLGLKVGTIIHGLDPDTRRKAYRSDVTYCTNKEVAFDYLKDRIVLGRETDRLQLQVERLYERRPRIDQLLLRGLFFGIVDEADSVLVDEARTPLIISGAKNTDSSERETYQTALAIASQMTSGRDFVIEGRDRSVRILPPGLEQLANVAATHSGVWVRRQWREELVRQALTALHLFIANKQYLVRDDKIQIVDEYTGRVMPDRSWEHGLHQMIEVKEGCPMTKRIDPLARISYQRFFRRYLWLAGMTGTAREVTGELWSVYRLATRCIPTNKPSGRRRLSDRIYAKQDEKWRAIVERIAEIHALGRPVLVGTRSVAASEHLSSMLNDRALPYQLLNARQDLDEAMIIAQAGGKGRITIATNMAGRGTDIQLEPGVAEIGGLHVIATELHEARRIDRQLFGRGGRQGDPGTCEAIVSLEDELAQVYTRRAWRKLGAAIGREGRSSRARAASLLMAQRAAERLHHRMRRDLLKMDERLDSTLAFSGRSE
jgi:preprotein translocase subunit SecA